MAQAEVEALRKRVKQLEDELKNDDLKVRVRTRGLFCVVKAAF